MTIRALPLALLAVLWAGASRLATLELDCTRHRADHPLRISVPGGDVLAAEWADGDGQRFRVEFALAADRPLLRRLAASPNAQAPLATLAEDVDLHYRLTLGSRKPGLAWYCTFFDLVDTLGARGSTPRAAAFR